MDHTNSRHLKEELKDHAIIDSGCSGSMTRDKDKLSDFKDYKGGYVAFSNDPKGGRIKGKGTIKTSCIDFENVSYVKELKFNLLSVSQICDKKHKVLFTDTECLILSPEFKIVDENLVLLRAPRKNDVYSLNLKNIIPSGGVTFDTAVKQSNSFDFEDVDDQQFIVHGSSSIGNKAGSGAITNDAQNKDSDESTVDKAVPLTLEDQVLQKEFENLMLQEAIANTHMANQGNVSEK
ncbi:hypothetical protein Tco_0095335, partial [Tanacetum coccineum]